MRSGGAPARVRPVCDFASRHAAHLPTGDFRNRIYRPQGRISPVLLVEGQLAGVWKHEPKANRLLVGLQLFGDQQDIVHREVGQEAERLAEFLGGVPEVSWAS